MPYQNEEYYAGFILPLEWNLENMWDLINSCKLKYKVIVHIPKFTQRTKIDLAEELPKLGLVDIFDPMKAQLNDICDSYVSDMVRKLRR